MSVVDFKKDAENYAGEAPATGVHRHWQDEPPEQALAPSARTGVGFHLTVQATASGDTATDENAKHECACEASEHLVMTPLLLFWSLV